MPDSAFRNRNFVLFFVGQLVSNSGTWLHNVAQGVLVLELTGRSVVVGATTAALFVPVLLLAPIGGRLADRFDHRRILIVAQCSALVATATLTVMVATGNASVGAVAVVALVVGTQAAVFTPTMGALLPTLVSEDQLGQAIGLNSATYNAARAIGPILATAAIAGVGFAFAFGLNAASYVFLIAALTAIRPPRRPDRPRGGNVRAALSHMQSRRRLQVMLLGVVVVSMAADPVLTLSPVFAEEFGRPASDAGFLVTAFGLGAIATAVAFGRAFRVSGARRYRYLWASIPAYAIGLAGFALAPTLAVGAAALVLAGGAFLATNTTFTTGVLEETPSELHGRIMGLWTVAFLGTRPIAALIDGALADLVHPRVTPIVFAVPLLAVGLFAAAFLSGGEREPDVAAERAADPTGAVDVP